MPLPIEELTALWPHGYTFARNIYLNTNDNQGFDVAAYAAKLDPGAPALAPLGISPETLRDWKAGYSNSGTNRGRLAIALHDRDGNTVGFAGRALGEEQSGPRNESAHMCA